MRRSIAARAGSACWLATVVALSLAALVTGCGGGDSGPAAPDTTIATVSVTPTTASLAAIGATTTLSAVARNTAGDALTVSINWGSSDASVASVSAAGVVTAVANGTATISALAGGVQGTAQVSVQQVITTLTVSPPADTLVIGVARQFAATARDAQGIAIAAPTIAWSSSTPAVASVSATGLVTAVAVGMTSVTAQSGTVSAVAIVNVRAAPLAPTTDTTWSGTINAGAITIPVGVTVTATSGLIVRADGPVTIGGTLTGSCVPMDLVSDTALTVTGTVRNGCQSGVAAPLRLSATGELTLTDALIESSGDITLSNDPTLTESSFPTAGSMPVAAPARMRATGIPFTRVSRTTVRFAGGGDGPDPAKPGADGVNGADGDNGRAVRLLLAGKAVFAGGSIVWGQNGGRGGDGAQTLSNNVTVTGGAGGVGGLLRVLATDSLRFEGAPTIFRAGRGGNGGAAMAVATKNAALAQGPSATATGGAGGLAGLIDIRSGTGITIANAGALELQLGAGDGGAATATGAPGANALENGGGPAQVGGAASATSGAGGRRPTRNSCPPV